MTYSSSLQPKGIIVPVIHPGLKTPTFLKNFESISKIRPHISITDIPTNIELDVLYPTTINDHDALVVKLATGRIFLYLNKHNNVIMEHDTGVRIDEVLAFSRHIQDIRHDHV